MLVTPIHNTRGGYFHFLLENGKFLEITQRKLHVSLSLRRFSHSLLYFIHYIMSDTVHIHIHIHIFQEYKLPVC